MVVDMTENGEKDFTNETLRAKIIFGLASEPIDLKTIIDNKEIGWFFYPRDEERAIRRALFRAEKWLVKRKIDVESPLGKEIADQMVESWGCRSLVDVVVNTVLGHYGISGGVQLDYKKLAYKVMKIVKDYHIKEWAKRILDALDDWKRKYKVDEDALQSVALATAKVTAEYFHGSRWHGFRHMRLPRPAKEKVKEPIEEKGEVEQSGSS